MSATQISPSQSIEASLLSHHPPLSPPPPPTQPQPQPSSTSTSTFTHSPTASQQSHARSPSPSQLQTQAQAQAQAQTQSQPQSQTLPPLPPSTTLLPPPPSPPPPTAPPQHSSSPLGQDDMDHQSTPPPPPSPPSASPPPPALSLQAPSQPSEAASGQDHDRMSLDAQLAMERPSPSPRDPRLLSRAALHHSHSTHPRPDQAVEPAAVSPVATPTISIPETAATTTTSTTPPPPPPTSSSEQLLVAAAQSGAEAGTLDPASASEPALVPPTLAGSLITNSDTTTITTENAAPAATATTTENPGENGPDNGGGDDDDDDDDDDDNADDDEPSEDDDNESFDGDRDFLATLVEDTSAPADDELAQIADSTERSALDHKHWESLVYTALDDPEYATCDSGTITWTLHGFHGTKDAPNKQRIMRSPVVHIGGYRWNLKVFPHGNEGTDQVSVYVECTGEVGAGSPVVAKEEDDVTMQGMPIEIPSLAGGGSNDDGSGGMDTSKLADHAPPDAAWEVAAQIGCVMYNPQEPRVHVFEKASHQFQNVSQDWGWVRYHGPWRDLHLRRQMQRQAILRNDTLSFTAFVRIVKDPTRALWWRQTDGAAWDSVAKTGLRGLTAEDTAYNAFIAALAPWLHLAPFRRLILETPIVNPAREPLKRARPMIEQLRDAIYAKHSATGNWMPASLYEIEKMIEWYSLEYRQSTEVVEVWEMMRHILNQEYWNERDDPEANPDVLSFIRTIKQKWTPSLPSSAGPVAQEPQSVQEVMDAVAKGEATNYEDWSGHGSPSSEYPEVLQIELHRQRYDTAARKWKRLTHRIRMDETITFGPKEYTLYGMVVSKGELGSGRMYSIIRSSTSKSQWARYKGGSVTYLTRKQAVECHEGKSTAREGGESVAYVVLYVRSDAADRVLPEPIRQPTSKLYNPLQATSYRSSDELAKMPAVSVVVHKSSAFPGYSQPGFIEPYDQDAQNLYEMSLAPGASLLDVQSELIARFQVADSADQCRLWALKLSPSPHQRSPRLEWLPPNTKLQEFAYRLGGIHLWLYVVPVETIEEEKKKVKKAMASLAAEQEAAASAAAAALPPPPPPPPGPSLPEIEDIVMGGTDEIAEIQIEAAEASLALTDVPAPPPEILEAMAAAEAAAAAAVAAVANVPEPLQVPPSDGTLTRIHFEVPELQSTPPPPPPPSWPLENHAYLFIKVFDPRDQSLRGLGSFLVPWSEKISSILESVGVQMKSPKIFFENGLRADESNLTTESALHPHNLPNGSILVLSNTEVSENDLEIMRERGEATDAAEHYQILSYLAKYTHQGPFHRESFFGGAYTHASLHKGRHHGPATLISTTGDAFVGQCVGGHKAGAEGTMYYGSGDTYTGSWAADVPEGEGTMVYHTTGNTYVGGWKAGRRHGKGTMRFEVADEELRLCRICYEAEMDALFFRCGHVVACESCARQVRDCPVCRRGVDAVVKIWRT